MKTQSFIILIINAIAYIYFFIVYQCKKQVFDIGSIILLTWMLGSIGSVYYYTFEASYISYDTITVGPLIFLFIFNFFLFRPFLKTDYGKLKKIEVYNLGGVLNYISLFFSIIGLLPLIDVMLKLSTFSLAGAALADMYSSEEDKTTLIFSPMSRPLFSIMRHFTILIVFLFFFQLSRHKVKFFYVVGLGGNIIMFLLFSLLSGSRGGIVSLLLMCSFFFILLKGVISPSIVRIVNRFAIALIGMVIIGIGAISVSRLGDMSERKGRELLMDQWISQYIGEGMVKYDYYAWHLDKKLNGAQNLPYLYSYKDGKIKDLDTFSIKAESKLGIPITVFYTYVGDLIIDFGIIGTCVIGLMILIVIKYLIKIRNGKLSIYHLILLSFFYEYLSIGFTANIFRTYYTQLQIVETILLLGIMYIFQKLNEKRYALLSNNNTRL